MAEPLGHRPARTRSRASRLRFDGVIAGLGTRAGVRIVVGHWWRSPFGPVSDVMLETPDGHRLLLAPTSDLARFISATYAFDEVRVTPVSVGARGDAWAVAAGPLDLRFRVGRRGRLGRLLRAVPAPLARRPAWIAVVDLPARLLLPGVRTRGGAGGDAGGDAGGGRREWYGARDLRPVVAATARLDGRDLGPLAPVDPPVRFGFASTPRTPALVRITTTVEVPSTAYAGRPA